MRYCAQCATPLSIKRIDGKERLACDHCSFIFWNNPKPTTSIILEQEGKVLFLQRSHEPFKGYWVLPGGYVEYDEDPKDTIVREVKEETGLTVKLEEAIYTYLIDTDPRGNSIDIVFEGKITGGKLALREHSQGKFFSQSDLPSLIAYKHREVVEQWYRKK